MSGTKLKKHLNEINLAKTRNQLGPGTAHHHLFNIHFSKINQRYGQLLPNSIW